MLPYWCKWMIKQKIGFIVCLHLGNGRATDTERQIRKPRQKLRKTVTIMRFHFTTLHIKCYLTIDLNIKFLCITPRPDGCLPFKHTDILAKHTMCIINQSEYVCGYIVTQSYHSLETHFLEKKAKKTKLNELNQLILFRVLHSTLFKLSLIDSAFEKRFSRTRSFFVKFISAPETKSTHFSKETSMDLIYHIYLPNFDLFRKISTRQTLHAFRRVATVPIFGADFCLPLKL